MMAGSHVVTGITAWAAVCLAIGQPPSAAGFALAALGALAPDIDHPRSWIGRRLSPISILLAKVVGHRGVTHSLLAIVAGMAALRWYGLGWTVAPMVIGYLSHLAGDACTPSGVPLFWPWRWRVSVPLFKTGSLLEYGFVLLLVIGTAHAWGLI